MSNRYKLKMLNELDKIDKKFDNGEISKHEHDVLSKRILNKYEIEEKDYFRDDEKKILGEMK